MNKTVIPEIVIGNEEIYRRFIQGKLIYKPDPNSDTGKLEFPISDLASPLEGNFDLTGCGESSQYLSISTGYRKGKKAQNSNKIEIWIAPRFLIEKEINSTAIHFQPIMDEWNSAAAPIGVFWTWGDWDDIGWYEYLATESNATLSNDNLYEKWLFAIGDGRITRRTRRYLDMKNFMLYFQSK
jgi:hypothetical protein